MKTTIGMLFAAATLAMAAGHTYTGTVSDNMCGGSHAMMKVTPDSKCVTECVKAGAKYSLWDGKNNYTLSDQTAAAKYPAQKVTVTGTLDAKTNTIQVTSIAPAK
jgi:hypothetical protein